MKYDLYHDESKEGGYWHGMLLVPQNKRDVILKLLSEIRDRTKYPHFIHLQGLNKKGKRFNCIRAWIQLGAGSLIQKSKGDPYTIFLTDGVKFSEKDGSPRTEFSEFFSINHRDKLLGMKFILFKERGNHSMMGNLYPDHASKIETTFRMGMKAGIHYLGGDDDTIEIDSIHFDGHEHYGRNIDKERIISRIYGLRDYCSFGDGLKIYDKPSNHCRAGSQDSDDCQFLQLTDLLVGCFRLSLDDSTGQIQNEVAFPIKRLIDERWMKGYARMKNSRWFKGFYLSECWLEDDYWQFDDFKIDTKNLRLLYY